MSVLARKRSLSELEFYKNGKEIRAEFTRFLISDRIPKRAYWTFTKPGIKMARKMMQEITAANTIYVKKYDDVSGDEAVENTSNIIMRRKHQYKAIIECEKMIQHIQFMIDTLETVMPSHFMKVKETDEDKIFEKILKQVTLLKAWRNAYTVSSPKKD